MVKNDPRHSPFTPSPFQPFTLPCLLLAILLPTPTRAAGPTSLPTNQPMPQAVLDQLYRRELGALYKPADAAKYFQAHQLIERYFAAPSDRPQVIRDLEALHLDTNLIGRLVRIRLDWPELSDGAYYINQRVGPHDVRYFLGIPKDYDRTKPWPLVIKLPEADAFVAEPRPDPQQVTEIYSSWMIDELKHHPDAIVIMPLLNLDELWGPSYEGMNSVIQPMLHAANLANIDPARVYMVGHGMSAHATWNLALNYTTYFASFLSLAGSASQDWQRLRAMNLRDVLPIVWQDADDPVQSADSTGQLISVLRAQKVEVSFERTQHVGHIPPAELVDELYSKMRARVRPLYPKQVAIQSSRPDTMFNRNDWVQIYQPMNVGDEQRLLFTHGSGFMMVYPTGYSVEAAINNNTITATSRNVAVMRFYLNDQMIDFSRAVSVVLNGRPRFEAILKPNLEEMLKDQLFLGRGWRYYTAVIDLDFNAPARGPSGRATTRPLR